MKAYRLKVYLVGLLLVLFSGSVLAVVNGYINNSVSPADDFYQHATGGAQGVCRLKDADKALQENISTCVTEGRISISDNNKMNDMPTSLMPNKMYNSLIDKTNIDKTLAEVRSIFRDIDNIENTTGIIKEIAYLNKLGVGGLLDISVNRVGPNSIGVVYIKQGIDRLIPIDSLITLMAGTLNIINNGVDLRRIRLLNKELVELERGELSAAGSVVILDKKMFQEVEIEQPAVANPDFWTPYFTAHRLFGNVKTLYIQPANINKTIKLLNNYTVDEWKTYLKLSYLDVYSDIFKLQIQEFTSDKRKELAINIIKTRFGNDLGRLCFDKYLSQNYREITDIIKNVFDAYKNSVISASYIDEKTPKKWVSETAKTSIIQKLFSIRVELGYEYPVERPGYSNIPITIDNPLVNAMRLSEFNNQYMMSQIGVRMGLLIWGNTILVSASATYSQNGIITIPLVYLMPPFFIGGDSAFNYAGLGYIVAHEIGHAFFSDEGEPLNIGTQPSDKIAFNERVNKLKKQYSSNLTIGEDGPDNLGLPIARRAYQLFLDKQPTRITEGKSEMSEVEEFYYDFAQRYITTYCSPNDRHSLGKDRVNGVLRNQDEFYTIFNVNPGNKMYLVPAEDPECDKRYFAPTCRVKFW
jgi:predicted metalloendopeptidase